MPLLSLLPPSPWSVFPSFCGGAVGTFPSCLLLPHQLQGRVKQGKDPLVCTKAARKGQGPRELFEYIFLLSLHEQREICHETMLNVLGRRTCSPQGLRAQWGVFAHPDFAVAVGTNTYLPAWELAADQHDFSTISSPQNSPKNLLLLINGSISAAHSLSHFFFAHSPLQTWNVVVWCKILLSFPDLDGLEDICVWFGLRSLFS